VLSGLGITNTTLKTFWLGPSVPQYHNKLDLTAERSHSAAFLPSKP